MPKDQRSGLFERMIKKFPIIEAVVKIAVILAGWFLFTAGYACEFMSHSIAIFLDYIEELRAYAKEVWTTDF